MENCITFKNINANDLREFFGTKPLYINQGAVHWGKLVDKNEFKQLCDLLENVGFKKDPTPTDWQDLHVKDATKLFDDGIQVGERPTIVLGQVEHLHPQTRYILRWLDIPWIWSRLPTVFMSCSSVGGGIGVHFDDDDNIIVQAEGKRHWRISHERVMPSYPDCDGGFDLTDDNSQEYILNPGDVLYVPRGYWHEGITMQESLSVTLGWDSISIAEVLAFIAAYKQSTSLTITNISTFTNHIIYSSDKFELSAQFKFIKDSLNEKFLSYLPEYCRFYDVEPFLKESFLMNDKRKIPSIIIEFIQEQAQKIQGWNLTDEEVSKGYAAFLTKPVGIRRNNVFQPITRNTVLKQFDSTFLCYQVNLNYVALYAFGEYLILEPSMENFCTHLCNTPSFTFSNTLHWVNNLDEKYIEYFLSLLIRKNFLFVEGY